MRRRQATGGASRRRGLRGAAAFAGSAVAAVVVVALVIKWAPQWLASTEGLEPRARAEDIGRTRTALLAILAGAIATVGAIYTARSYALSRQGHITERYTRAVAQLGDGADAVRLGGIYALERIARDSPSDHRTIMDVLSAYVRLHAGPSQRFGDDNVKPDVEAAILVLGRRRTAHEPEDGVELVLNDVNLRGARIRGVHLERARMRNARLPGALLDGAWLDATALEGADLRRAHLRDASLRHASLERADLREADLGGARLEGAVLIGAMLAGADLRGATLEGAVLNDADLREVAHDQFTRWPPGFNSSAQGAPGPTKSTL